MVNNLVFRWPKPLFFMVLGAYGIYCILLLCSFPAPSPEIFEKTSGPRIGTAKGLDAEIEDVWFLCAQLNLGQTKQNPNTLQQKMRKTVNNIHRFRYIARISLQRCIFLVVLNF